MPRTAQRPLQQESRSGGLLYSPGKMPPDDSRPLPLADPVPVPSSNVSRSLPSPRPVPPSLSPTARSGTFLAARLLPQTVKPDQSRRTYSKTTARGSPLTEGVRTQQQGFYQDRNISSARFSKLPSHKTALPARDGGWLGKSGLVKPSNRGDDIENHKEDSDDGWPGEGKLFRKPSAKSVAAQEYVEKREKDVNALVNNTGKESRERRRMGSGKRPLNALPRNLSNTFSEADKKPVSSLSPSRLFQDLNANKNPINVRESISKVNLVEEEKSAQSPSLEPLTNQPAKSHLIGLKNVGNTCYMLAPLQSMLGLPRFVTDCINLQTALVSGMESNKEEEMPLLLEPFSDLCRVSLEADSILCNYQVQQLKKHIESISSQFKGSQMQDANELLVLFLDQFKENVDKLFVAMGGNPGELEVKDSLGKSHDMANPVVENFQFEKERNILCLGCGNESSTRESDINLFLDLSSSEVDKPVQPISLQALLEKTTQQEQRERRCDKCNHDQASVGNQMVSLPRVLVLSLKRYRYTHHSLLTSQKVKRLVHIPSHLDLHPLVSSTCTVPTTFLPTRHSSSPTSPTTPTNTTTTTTPTSSSTPESELQARLPSRFQGLDASQLAELSEDDQLQYMLLRSKAEAGNSEHAAAAEERELQEAIEASMRETLDSPGVTDTKLCLDGWASSTMSPSEVSNEMNGIPPKLSLDATIKEEDWISLPSSGSSQESLPNTDSNREQGSAEDRKQEVPQTSSEVKTILNGLNSPTLDPVFRTPNRKRTSEQINDSEMVKVQKMGSEEKNAVGKESPLCLPLPLTPRSSPSPNITTPPGPPSPRSSSAVKNDTIRRPLTQMEENEDLRLALELSIREDQANNSLSSSDIKEDASSVVEPPLVLTGPQEHRYRLHSVVSHYGASSSSGHYVADVFRFDAGQWFRYDDMSVIETSEEKVRGERSQQNGYIFMYIHQPLWDACQAAASST